MAFPVWHFTGLNSGLIIGVVSILHVFIAQFAVGGGIYLVWMEYRARRENQPEILAWLERHTHFFLLVTMVFGALSGVGIWFTISVVNPAATSLLIHNFVFFWAAEWVFFLLEVITLLIYYYTYSLTRTGRMAPGTHLGIGIVYAVSGYLSLVLINGIITFMLTPGVGLESGNVWDGFFNPTYWPSLVFRSGICITLAGMFALFTTPRIESVQARRYAVRSSSLWIILPFLILLGGAVWYFVALPPDRMAAVFRRTADIHPALLTFLWILPIMFMGGVVAYGRAERLRRPLAVLILLTGLTLVGSFEGVRETARRPWVAGGGLYSNGVSPDQLVRARAAGGASVSGWLRAVEDPAARPVTLGGPGRGAQLFAQQCAACHGLGSPRMDVLDRTAHLTPAGLNAQLLGEGRRLTYMPPFAGDEADRAALAIYLESMRAPRQPAPFQEAP